MNEDATNAAALAVIEGDRSLAVHTSAEQLGALYERLSTAISACEEVQASLAEMAGPVPSPLPAHLLTMMQLGTGHFRHCRDTLASLYRQRNSAEKAARQTPGGANDTPD